MFKKKPTIKTLSPLRSSDRRKTADRIIADYGLHPASSDATGENEGDSTSALTLLRKSLLPENALSAKFATTFGPHLKELNGMVYVGSHDSGEQRVLWVRMNDKLYPTVYTLWKNPRILPLLHTPTFVVGKLKGGADLMTPGLAGPPFPGGARKNALVAIASVETPSVPVAVGTCVIDVADLQTTQGAKGHAVETFHWAGDELWDWSTSGRPGSASPAEIPGWLGTSQDSLPGLVGRMTLDDEEDQADEAEGGVSLDSSNTRPIQSNSSRNPHLEGEDAVGEVVDLDDNNATVQMKTEDIDNVFLNAFLYGVHNQKETAKGDSKFGLKFPLTQSFVMSNLVLPFLPIFSPEQASILQIKRTNWKNARKFIMALGNKKLALVKDSKSEALIRDIDFEDRAVLEFTPYALPKKEPSNPGASSTAAKQSSFDGDDSIGQQLKIQNLYRPRESLSRIFRGSKTTKGPYYSAAAIREAVVAYCESNQLIKQSNKRLITLDPELSNAVLSTSNNVDRDILAKGSLPRDILIERVVALCSPFHVILRNSATIDSSDEKPRPGIAPTVGIILETRGGNKTVTRVYGFEPYSINPQPLADELRKACAGSTSIEPFKGGKGMEVMVQGPQREAVSKALEKRGINKQWIETTDKTKGKKK